MVDSGHVIQGRYRLGQALGRSAFARVFLAADLALHRQVAVKVLNPEVLAAGVDRDYLEHFRRGARAIAAIEHPNILGIHDYGEADGIVYIVMPYVESGTLHARLAGGPPPTLDEIAAYLRQAAAALDYAHARGRTNGEPTATNMLH